MTDQTSFTDLLRAMTGPASETLPASICGDGSYQIGVASRIGERKRAWALVHQKYLQKGFAEGEANGLWYGLHDALPSTVTFLVSRAGAAVATATQVFDSPVGLPADELYGDELATLRRQGRRPSEVISLTCTDTSLTSGTEILKHLFRLNYLTALRLEGATDVIVTVNPCHTFFYERCLQFTRLGPERSYDKVGGAPAVLLRLDLARFAEEAGTCGDHRLEAFHRFFFRDPVIDRLLQMVRQGRRPLDEASLRRYFIEERPFFRNRDHMRRVFSGEASPLDCRKPHYAG